MVDSHVYVALLRGINVGGKNKVVMADLQAMFERLGYHNVKTYINSGNIIFQTPVADAPQIERDIEKLLAGAYSFPVRVIVLTLKEMASIVASLPSHWQTTVGIKHDVILLHRTIDSPTILGRFHPNPDIETLQYCPRALLWSVAIKSFSKSNVTSLTQLPIYQDMTVRGPGTVLKLYELMQSIDRP